MKPVDPAAGAASGPPGAAPRSRPSQRLTGWWNGATRALLVVFGGLLILQSSDRLDAPKVGYLVVAAIATAGSAIAVWRARGEPATTAMRPWLFASVVILALVALSLPVALFNGATASNWLRDAAAYVLLGAAPWLAIDLARSASTRFILATGLTAGLLGVASFVLEWVQRRQLADLPFERLGLPSMSLGAAAYCLTVACAVRSRGWSRVGWIALSMAILAAFLMTGTRTTFVLLIVPAAVLAIELWQRGRAGLRAGTLPAVAQIAAVGVVLFVSLGGLAPGPLAPTTGPSAPAGSPGTGGPTGTDPPSGPDLEDRFSTLDDISSGRDQSLRLRIEQTRIALEVFAASPLVGIGLGHEFSYMESPTRERRGLTLDTPAIVLAKFGILGLVLTGVLVASLLIVIRAMIRRGGTNWRVLTLIGYGAVLLALVPFGWPPEDKGTSFALVFLLALAAVDWNPSAEIAV